MMLFTHQSFATICRLEAAQDEGSPTAAATSHMRGEKMRFAWNILRRRYSRWNPEPAPTCSRTPHVGGGGGRVCRPLPCKSQPDTSHRDVCGSSRANGGAWSGEQTDDDDDDAASHKPSESLQKATMQTAEALSATLATNRNCSFEITNVSSVYCLVNPKVYMSSGFCCHPPQPTVRSARTELCSFIKDDHTVTGAVGLLTYDLFHMQGRACSQRMAVMFSVPYDRNLYKNRLAVGVFEASRACDKKLYELMYDGKDTANFSRADASGSGVVYGTDQVDVRATMSTVGKAIIKLEFYDQLSR
ncbi:bryoporin-like isoform X2 [Syngnathoides biaculeatus]|uniref:bryoporin-like isoform X2 n=1 Tax=Syngnathoides biaculeatus TaxID=300417 RepID=UPI002ADE0FDF|nr:bryoporin-like isoform X2 [Syngnathoides biaculeatus]